MPCDAPIRKHGIVGAGERFAKRASDVAADVESALVRPDEL